MAAGSAIAAVACVAAFFGASLLSSGTVAPGLRPAELDSSELNFLAGGPAGVLDSDLDGLSDAVENLVLGSDPHAWNTTGSSVPDGWLAAHGYDPTRPGIDQAPAAAPPAEELPEAYRNVWPDSNVPTLAQVYAFGRPADWDEATKGPFDSGLDPRDWDANDDGIPDGWLLLHGLDPREAGVGARTLAPGGLSVLEAFEHATDPTTADSDGDGLTDREEIDGPANPLGTPARFGATDPSRRDTLGLGACDGYLVAYGFDPTLPASLSGDPDNDGASTAREAQWTREHRPDAACGAGGLDPRKATSGSSLLPDGWLLRHGLNPFSAPDANVTQASDTDERPAGAPPAASVRKLTVADEYALLRPAAWSEEKQGPWWGGTDPSVADTDGDGLGDAYEAAGFNVNASTRPGGAPMDYLASSRPTAADGDGDGLDDGAEALAGTDPLREDTDFDALPDGRELLLDVGLLPTRADSAGDLLRDGERLRHLEDRVKNYTADQAYTGYGNQPGSVLPVTAWLSEMPGGQALGHPVGPGDIDALLGPLGDLDKDGLANVVDDDIDNDTLSNGWELHPALYAQSPYTAGELPAGRPPSDPLNPDTDGDGLDDAWEIENARVVGGRWNLDPGDWDADGDGKGDALEDPDNDGTVWVAFDTGPVRRETVYAHTNLQEFRYGTDPNDPFTDGDELRDGWKVFWAIEYPTLGLSTAPSAGIYRPDPSPQVIIPASAKRPIPGQAQNASDPGSVIRSVVHSRVVADATKALPWELPSGAHEAGNGIEVQALAGTYAFTLHDAQRAGTNPYLLDTDGDSMPDWWEDLHRVVLPDSPQGLTVGGCAAGPGPDATRPDRVDQDADGDGLGAAEEFAGGSDPHCKDSDRGGVPDGTDGPPALDPGDPTDDAGLQAQDSDGDGVQDFDELRGRMLSVRGVQRLVQTDPQDPDTDGDGLLDGSAVGPLDANSALAVRLLALGSAYQLRTDGKYTFPGERNPETMTDPSDPDDSHAGVPAGWLWTHQQPMSSPSSTAIEAYRLGRPAWWQEAKNGVWWGGADPGAGDLSSLRNRRDLDGDLLADRDSNGDPMEDAMPGANKPNALRAIDWDALDMDPAANEDPTSVQNTDLQRRILGQAYMNPAPSGAKHTVPHPTSTTDSRPTACLQATAPSVLWKGQDFMVTGQLKTCAAPQAPLGGVAVEARLRGLSFGAGVTQPDGSFSFPVNITYEHQVPVPAGSVYRGAAGFVSWRTDAATVPVGANLLAVQSYGTPAVAPASASPISVTVKANSALSLQVPDATSAGKTVPLQLRLTDTAGTPLRHPVLITWDGVEQPLVTPDADGSYTGNLPSVPATRAGVVELRAVSKPPAAEADTAPALASDSVIVRRNGVLDLAAPAQGDAGALVTIEGTLTSVLSPTNRQEEPGARVFVNLTIAGNTVASAETLTGAGGRVSALLQIPVDAPTGPAVVTGYAVPSDKVAAATREASISLRGRPAFQDVELGDLAVGSVSHVAGRLVVAGCAVAPCAGIGGATIAITLGDESASATTDAQGVFEADLPPPTARGLARQELVFAGDLGHAAGRHAADRSVVSASRLAMEGGSVLRGATAAPEARLTDAAGVPVAGARVSFTWGSSPPASAVTNADGVARLTRPTSDADALGPVPVRASFVGQTGAGLGPAVATATWLVRSPLRIVLPSEPVVLGEPVPQGILFNGVTGAPVPGAWVDVYLEGAGAVARRTDTLGRFPLMDATNATQEPRVVRVAALHRATAQQEEARASSDFRLVSPVTAAVHAPERAVAGDEILLLVDLLDGAGQVPDGGNLTVEALGEILATVPVAGDPPRVSVRLPAGASAGPVPVHVSYSGSGTHAATEATATVQALARLDLQLFSKAVRAGETATVEALVTLAGEPVAGRTVVLRLEGQEEGLTAVTDEEGRATFRVPDVGETRLLAARVESESGASGASVLATVTPLAPAERPIARSPWPWVAAGGVLILGFAVAALAYLLRRHPLATPLLHARHAIAGHGPLGRRIVTAYRALDDAAIALELQAGPARTPRLLQQAVAPTLPPAVRPDLERLMGVFEEARYGGREATQAQADTVLACLDRIQAALRRRALRGWSVPEATI